MTAQEYNSHLGRHMAESPSGFLKKARRDIIKLFSRMSPLEREMRSKTDEELEQIVTDGKKETAHVFVRCLRICLEFDRRLNELDAINPESEQEMQEYVDRSWDQFEKFVQTYIIN